MAGRQVNFARRLAGPLVIGAKFVSLTASENSDSDNLKTTTRVRPVVDASPRFVSSPDNLREEN